MENQKIDIQQAKEWEKFNKTLNTSDEFKTELAVNNISDIFSDTQIKQDKDKYIFSINGINKFAIDGKINLVNWIQDFYTEQWTKEKQANQEQVLIRIEWLELQYIKAKTQEELNMLKSNINKVKSSVEKATDVENVKYKVERLITFFQQEKKLTNQNIWWFLWRQYDRKDRWLFKISKEEIQVRLNGLYKIQKEIKKLEKNKDKNYGKLKMDDINEMDMKTTLKQYSERIEELGKEAPNFILTRNDIVLGKWDTVPYFEIMGYSKSDAKKLNKSLEKINTEYAILDELKLTWAKRQELSQDLQDLQEYLNNVINNPDTFKPSEHPFIPTHTKEFFTLMNIKPTPEQYQLLNKEADNKEEETTPTEIIVENHRNNENNRNNNSIPTNISNYGSKNYLETFKTWGVTGILRKTLNMFPNMSNEAKNTWTNLLVIGGVGFGVFKLAKWLFSGKRNKDQKEATPFWKRLLIAWWVTLGFNAFGSNPLKFAQEFIGWGLDTDKLKMQWPWAVWEKVEDWEKELTYIELNEIFGTLPISKLKEFIDPKTFALTQGWCDGLLGNFQWTDNESKAKRALIEKIRKNKDNDILKTSFAKVGITPENINNLNQNKTVKEYTENSAPTIENIDIRDNKDDERIKVTEQVKNFNITEKQKNNLIKYGNILYDEKPWSSNQKVEFKEKDTKIYLKTYGERTEIDIEKLNIIGYKTKDWSPIVFDGYKELMKAANLTNYMKSLFRGKAKWNMYAPFEKAGLAGKLTRDRWDIMFNDGTQKYNPIHTEAIDGWRFGTLGKVSKRIEDHKEEYINYLNDLRIWNESRAMEWKSD